MRNLFSARGVLSIFLMATLFYDLNSYAISIPYSKSLYQSSTIQLPVEVLGSVGTVVDRSFNLDATSSASASKLYLRINNLSYQNKGSVRINGGSWIPLNHSTTTLQQQEMARGGMVHGGFNTIRLTLPVSNFRQGNNIVEFRFDKSDAISIGYRVIQFNVLSDSGTPLLPAGLFSEDDPANWTAPLGYDNAAAVAAGKDLWYNAELWSHYLPSGEKGFWYGQEIPARRVIKARCTSCHTQDGRDLEMFSYSNTSIVERAKFHNLSEDEGKKIAAYIRSLSDKPNVGRYGRPWNPPYQPGPELKDKPIEQWAAGAGLDAVLEDDAEMLPYLFPNGTSKESVRYAFDADVMDDRTLLPLSIQFPDWKHWLPIIHPMDAYNKNNWWFNQLPDDKNPVKAYELVRDWFDNDFNPQNFPSGTTVPQKLRQLWAGQDGKGGFRNFHAYNATSCEIKHWRTQCGEPIRNLSSGVPQELANTSLARLLAVKSFELMNEFELQDKAKHCVPDAMEDQPAERQWPSNTYSVFEVPAHFTAVNSRNYSTQEERTGHYETTTWYQLQFVLNGGNGFVGGTTPTDFNYVNPFILFASSASGVDEPLRYVSAINHMYQVRTWSKSTEPGNNSFRIRFQGPWIMMGSSDSNQEFYDPSFTILKRLDDIEEGLSDKVLEAMLLQFLDEVEKYDPDTWPRVAPHGGNYELDPKTKKTSDLIPIPHRGKPTGGSVREHYADKMYDIIPRIRNNFDVHCSIINRMADWSKSAWPLIDFEKFKIGGCEAETCQSTDIEADNIYRIRTKHNKCLSTLDYNGASVTQRACDYEDSNKWMLEDAGNSNYFIKNIATGQYLMSPNGNNGVPVTEAAKTGQDNQVWMITPQDQCTIAIASLGSAKCLDLKSGSALNGTASQQYACDPITNNRKFVLELIQETNVSPQTISIYKVSDASEGSTHAEFVVRIEGGEANSSGTTIQGNIEFAGTATAADDYEPVATFQIEVGEIETRIVIPVVNDVLVEDTETIIATLSTVTNANVGTSAAIAYIYDEDSACDPVAADNSMEIKTKHNKCFSAVTGTGITQQICDETDMQKWLMEQGEDGYFYIKNIQSDLYMEAPEATNGLPLRLTAYSGAEAQQWFLSQQGNCAYEITSKATGKCIDLKGGSDRDGAVIQQWTCVQDANASNRQFVLEEDQVLSITGMEDMKKRLVKIYPNPAEDLINITLHANASQAEVRLYNSHGILIRSLYTHQKQLILPLSGLANGVYYIEVMSEQSKSHAKFIKH